MKFPRFFYIFNLLGRLQSKSLNNISALWLWEHICHAVQGSCKVVAVAFLSHMHNWFEFIFRCRFVPGLAPITVYWLLITGFTGFFLLILLIYWLLIFWPKISKKPVKFALGKIDFGRWNCIFFGKYQDFD